MSFPKVNHLMHLRRLWLRVFILAAALTLAIGQIQCLFIPNDEDGPRIRNKPPSVKITGGLYDSDSSAVSYRVNFSWHGWDEDGVVTAFEWAVDDTTLETSWHWTTEPGGQLRFRATSVDAESGATLFDWHRFYLRSVDNESARSPVESRLFSASTISPETRITFPPFNPPITLMPRSFNIFWEGEDLDASDPELGPVFYEYKLIRAGLNEDPVEALRARQNVFLDTLRVGDRTAWIRVPSTTTSARLENLPLSSSFIFCVRAVDEAGAVEPTLDEGENFAVFEVSEEGCQPFVTMFESRLGSFVFPLDGPTWNVSAPSDVSLLFQWAGDLSFCGTRPGRVNYALDPVENDESPDGIGGWSGWIDADRIITPFSFPPAEEGKIHHFFLKMRDETHDPRSERLCWVQIRVQSFPLDRTVLIVDDATPPRRFGGTDAEHDILRDRLLACAWEALEPGEEVDFFDIYRAGDLSINPAEMSLSLLARYKLVIWNSFFFGRGESGLNQNECQRRYLSDYVTAGGSLYLFGSKPISALANDDYTDETAMGICPFEDWEEDDFIWKFLHIRSCVRGPRNNRVDGWVGARAVHPAYPDLDLNPEVWDPWRLDPNDDPVGGINACQLYYGTPDHPPEADPDLDTIYVARTFNWGGSSDLDGQPCALRYEPPADDPGAFQGRVFVQMFDLLFLQEEQAREAACSAINWLLTGRNE